jgi:hypothetical protein
MRLNSRRIMNRTQLNRFILELALALALTSALVGCASSPPQHKPAKSAQPERNSDAFAAEALSTYQLQRDGARTLNLMAAAVQQAPARSDIAYLQVALCRLIDGCGPEPFEARLRKMDAGNAIVWIRALANAQRQHDTAVEAQVLDAIARSERFDVYWNSLTSSITMARTPGPVGLETALNETVGWLGETIVPAVQPLTIACSRSRTADTAWNQRCRRVAQVLMNSDTYIVESVGIALAKQVTADSVELSKLDDRARSSRYLWRTSAEIIGSQVERDKFAAEHLQLMRKLRREQDVHSAITRWAGRPTTTPPDFRMDE